KTNDEKSEVTSKVAIENQNDPTIVAEGGSSQSQQSGGSSSNNTSASSGAGGQTEPKNWSATFTFTQGNQA
ncbi:MAG: hypothetical protein MI922_06075, partial [Bacteroidales bacterium]|nr:hypothetical protein [Bacteroidales bacterium]